MANQSVLKLMGKKRGMCQLFDENGNIVVCTVIEMEPNVVTQVKTVEKDGYNAIQLGFDQVTAKDPRRKEARTKKPQRGHFQKAGVDPRKHLHEVRLEDQGDFQIGQEFGVSSFSDASFVDATAASIGKGYQGLMKKNNFRGGPAAHGSGFHRHAGSTGMRSTPGRSLPGGPRPSQMGNKKVTVQNLQIVMIKEDENLLIVKGQVPGPKNGVVTIKPSVKKQLSKVA